MSKSRIVFQLNSDDDEDYLNFDRAPSVAAPKRGSSASKSKPPTAPHKPAAPRAVKAAPPDMYDASDYSQAAANASAAPGDDEDKTVNIQGKKIPLKSVQEHQQLINSLNSLACSVRFAPVLKECGIVIKNLSTKSIAELRELRERARACCSNAGGNGSIVSSMTLGVCGRIEALAPKRLIDLEGYEAAISSNPEFAALCELIEIDSGFKTSMSPMQRMALCLTTTALTVGSINKAKATGRAASQNLLAQLQQQQQQQQQQQERVQVDFSAAPAIVSVNDVGDAIKSTLSMPVPQRAQTLGAH